VPPGEVRHTAGRSGEVVEAISESVQTVTCGTYGSSQGSGPGVGGGWYTDVPHTALPHEMIATMAA
jgi:hypothetical protein